MNWQQNAQHSGSKNVQSRGVHATDNKNTKPEDYPLKASEMKELGHPAKPLYRNELHLDETIVSNEGSEVEDYHTVVVKELSVYRKS